MTETPGLSTAKRIFLRATGFGAGFAILLVILSASIYCWLHRQKPWNSTALKGKSATLALTTQPSESAYTMEMSFDVENTTNRDYDFDPYRLTLMSLDRDRNSLSKDIGTRQSGEPKFEGPPFIPAHGTGRIIVRVGFLYPDNFTTQDKDDMSKIGPSINARFKEIRELVLFDRGESYRIDLPVDWGIPDQDKKTEKQKP